MAWEWDLQNGDDNNDISLARFVIYSAYSETFKKFINRARENSKLPPSDDAFHADDWKGRYELVQKIYDALGDPQCNPLVERKKVVEEEGVWYAKSENNNSIEPKHNIRTPKEIFSEGKGNCLDLAILFCAVCWHYHLLPILFLIDTDKGRHAIAGVSLSHKRDSRLPDEHQNFFEIKNGKLSDELTEEFIRMFDEMEYYIAVECTGFAWDRSTNGMLFEFEDAKTKGKGREFIIKGKNQAKIISAIDIAVADSKKSWWQSIAIKYLETVKKLAKFQNIQNSLIKDKLLKSENFYVNPQLKAITSKVNSEDTLSDAEAVFEKHCGDESSTKLAIIGEPGSGKTLLLLQICEWVIARQEIPIIISLTDVWNFLNFNEIDLPENKRGLRQYLLEKLLLKEFAPQTDIEFSVKECKGAFKELLKSGKVWLLLDGANEIGSNEVLKKINDWFIDEDLTGVKLVLNCRLNEWKMYSHNLASHFDTYILQNYNLKQVHEFIGKWFNGDAEKIEDIKTKLANKYLQDLSVNPLRLALLCYIWQENLDWSNNLKRPLTRTDLFKMVVKEYYKRKGGEVPTEFKLDTSSQKIALNRVLGQLALKALNNEKTPFQMTDDFVECFLERKQTELKEQNKEVKKGVGLFELVTRWGWLNNLDTRSQSFEFFHSSFQEYFASQAIDDWDEFLPDNHINQPVSENGKDKPYRVFEPHWKEIILFWLGGCGGDEPENFRNQKTKFIEALVNFKDSSTNFYGYRAHFLAAEGIAELPEFKDCNQSRKIVEQIVQWSLGNFTNKKQPGETFSLPIRQTAMDVLERTDHKLVMERLNIINLDKGNDEEVKTISDFFERYPHENTTPSPMVFEDDNARCEKIEAIVATAKQLIQNCANYQNHPVFWQAIERLGKIGKGDHDAIKFLKYVFDQSQRNTYLHLKSALHLAAIGISDSATQFGDLPINDFLVRCINEDLRESPDPSIQQKLEGYLSSIAGITEPGLSVLSRLLYFYIQLTGKRDIRELIDVASKIKTIGDYELEVEYQTNFEELRKLLPDRAYTKMIISLKEYLSSEREEEIQIHSDSDTEAQPSEWSKLQTKWSELQIADYLYKKGEPSERFCDCYKTLWYCAQVMPYPEFYSAFNQESK